MKLVQNLLFVLVLLPALAASAEEKNETYVNIRVLSAPLAAKIATVAEQHCFKKGYQVSVAVTDRYGSLLAFSRNPLAGSHTIDVSQYKAYTSATFQIPSMRTQEDMAFLQGVPKLALFGGGIPVRVGGHMYGAIGVSGAPAKKKPGDVDEECAQAGLDAVMGDLEFAE
jgi:uncharacterized protein GlcG (DUF336 family)